VILNARVCAGDVLLTLRGQRCATFTLLEELLDDHVGAPLHLEVRTAAGRCMCVGGVEAAELICDARSRKL
jgi:hypothetical protein